MRRVRRARLAGLNLVGLERRGFSRDDVRELRAVYRFLFQGDGTLAERTDAAMTEHGGSPLVAQVLAFIRNRNSRALCLPRQENGR